MCTWRNVKSRGRKLVKICFINSCVTALREKNWISMETFQRAFLPTSAYKLNKAFYKQPRAVGIDKARCGPRGIITVTSGETSSWLTSSSASTPIPWGRGLFQGLWRLSCLEVGVGEPSLRGSAGRTSDWRPVSTTDDPLWLYNRTVQCGSMIEQSSVALW